MRRGFLGFGFKILYYKNKRNKTTNSDNQHQTQTDDNKTTTQTQLLLYALGQDYFRKNKIFFLNN